MKIGKSIICVFGLLAVIVILYGFSQAVNGRSQNMKHEAFSPHQILKEMGWKGIEACPTEQISAYKQTFKKLDTNGDGKMSEQEYIENSTYGNPMVRKGIFRATDRDRDGMATEKEYVENRIITDEAKIIFKKIDRDGDMNLSYLELSENILRNNAGKAQEIFRKLDINGDGKITMVEFLKVFGNWARENSVDWGTSLSN